jgi:hypothetical protein
MLDIFGTKEIRQLSWEFRRIDYFRLLLPLVAF